MALEVVWTPTAAAKLAEVLGFLQGDWPHFVSKDFTVSLERQIELLKYFPEIGIRSKREPSIRKVLVTKHNALYYAFNSEQIVILAIIDTRSQGYSGNTD